MESQEQTEEVTQEETPQEDPQPEPQEESQTQEPDPEQGSDPVEDHGAERPPSLHDQRQAELDRQREEHNRRTGGGPQPVESTESSEQGDESEEQS